MIEWESNGRRFYITDVKSQAEYHEIEDIQREAWGFSDLDIVPAATLIAAQWCGAVVLCAYEASEMIGFVYGFPAIENNHISLHSHMLAVRPGWRNFQAGYFLKLAQRSRAMEMGIEEMSWTYDPLQSLNAHLNFSKLGVTSRRYIVNFYGEATSSPLHQGFGTDRLWVRWLLSSDRVQMRLDRAIDSGSENIEGIPLLVQARDERPALLDLEKNLSESQSLIEIPHNITSLKERNPDLAREWREATRAAFLAALESGFTVQDLVKQPRKNRPKWFYLLAR